MTAVIAGRLWLAYDYPPGRALWSAVFHSVQAFNNGGFALYTDGLVAFSRDPWVALPLSFGAIIGGLGFPALFEAVREWRRAGRLGGRHQADHLGQRGADRCSASATCCWPSGRNPYTIGTFDAPGKVLAVVHPDRVEPHRRLRRDPRRAAQRGELPDADRPDVHRRWQRQHRRRHQGLHVLPARLRHLGGVARRAGHHGRAPPGGHRSASGRR